MAKTDEIVTEVSKDVWYETITRNFGFSVDFDGLMNPILHAYYKMGDNLLGWIEYAVADRGKNPRYFLRNEIQAGDQPQS